MSGQRLVPPGQPPLGSAATGPQLSDACVHVGDAIAANGLRAAQSVPP